MADFMTPENELERQLLNDARQRAGLEWGTPRFGHPEVRVADHVATMLAGIASDEPFRSELRFLALVHDSFKAEVRPHEQWSRDNDHALLARRFAERYTSDERLLSTLELHDEPCWIWRNDSAPRQRLQRRLKRLPDPELFSRFVELEPANEGKDLTLLWWVGRELAIAGRLPSHPRIRPNGGSQEVVYVNAFTTSPEQQAAVANAAAELVAEQWRKMQANGEVFASDDGLRVVLQWHGHGSRRDLIECDADVIRDALAAYPILAEAQAAEARIFHTAVRP